MIIVPSELKVIHSAFENYGCKNQILKASEELSELNRAIARVISFKEQHPNVGISEVPDIENLSEELADVYITLEYVKMIVSEEKLLFYKRKKLERLRKKLKIKKVQELCQW